MRSGIGQKSVKNGWEKKLKRNEKNGAFPLTNSFKKNFHFSFNFGLENGNSRLKSKDF
jgi:hypothetical protein